MSNQAPPSGPSPCEYAGILGDSEDSDEELNPELLLAASWEELPVLERLGLQSNEEMTEEEVESAFAQFAMAFRCDQYTLTQRLEAEEHDCAVARENIQRELQHTKDTLQMLRGRCGDRLSGEVLQRMEASLEVVDSSMESIITAAETLGAAHQEARVSHAVALMAVHVEHLKRRHTLESAELLESRKLLHRSRGRLHSDGADDGDMRHSFVRQGSQQHLTRRRVSVTLIPSQSQLSDLEAKFSEACKANEDSYSQVQGSVSMRQGSRQPAVQTESSPSHSPEGAQCAQASPEDSTQSQEEDTDPRVSPRRALRLRRRGATVAEPQQDSSEEHQTNSEVHKVRERRPSEPVVSPEPCSLPPEQQSALPQPAEFPLANASPSLQTVLCLALLLGLLCYFAAPLLWL